MLTIFSVAPNKFMMLGSIVGRRRRNILVKVLDHKLLCHLDHGLPQDIVPVHAIKRTPLRRPHMNTEFL